MKGKQYAIVGGGIVGLSLAYKLLKAGTKVTLFERESSLAFHQSGNNSGVLHSGISYPVGSLKSKLCIDGYQQMIKYCSDNQVHFSLCGKYLFANSSHQFDYLKALHERAKTIGLKGARIVKESELKLNVPELVAKKALWIPQTGVVDYRTVCESLARSIEEMGGVIKLNSKVDSIQDNLGLLVIDKAEYKFDHIIIAAGNKTLSLSSNKALNNKYKLLSIKGEYYTTSIPRGIEYCLYPLPDPNLPFLGLHCHPDQNGIIEVGPTAIICKDEYQFDKSYITLDNVIPFLQYKEVRKMVYKNISFTIDQIFLRFSYKYFSRQVGDFLNISNPKWVYKRSGIRAQVVDNSGDLINDFKIHHVFNSTYLVNVPSPAATASLAIADFIITKNDQKDERNNTVRTV